MPRFSIIHPTARPEKWEAIYSAWLDACANPNNVEYILCKDPRWGFDDKHIVHLATPQTRDFGRSVFTVNHGRRCYVDSVNTAARESTGDVLIIIADDQFPCENWDVRLSEMLMGQERDNQFVVCVSTGTPDEHQRQITVMPILSRGWYERCGEVFYHEYESMFADNDFYEKARAQQILIDARHLVFPHRHAMFDGNGGWKQGAEIDDQYKAQMCERAWNLGQAILDRRRAAHFATLGPERTESKVPCHRSIVLCYPGEQFRGEWVDGIMDLFGHLMQRGFTVARMRQYTTNVYVTREECAKLMRSMEPPPDLVLWIDDDNICAPAQFDQLLADLDARPDLDGVAAWCWIHDGDKRQFKPSCGEWSPDHIHWTPFGHWFAKERELKTIEVTGFPCFLMRMSAITKAGPGAFFPIIDSRLEHGMAGEDLAFCLAAEQGGAKFAVDPQVRVEHLKYVAVEPVFPEQGAAEVKVAVMMRVKNEARWIRRCIESCKELAGENIFVFDDESTDRTAAYAFLAGATVFSDPFKSQALDERRDKNWLMAKVKQICNPDWILCIDGDEELEPGAAAKILRVLKTNPPIDCFSFRFLFLWNDEKTVRLDRWYSNINRQSLFRPIEGYEFKSYYEGAGDEDPKCHTGLHTSNAPYQMRTAGLNVFLLHYGYMFKEDRIRKWRWYLSIDPNNQYEDGYRHVVQGDVPEVPADAVLEHAGPLELRQLPPHLIPRFEVMPGPLEPERKEHERTDQQVEVFT